MFLVLLKLTTSMGNNPRRSSINRASLKEAWFRCCQANDVHYVNTCNVNTRMELQLLLTTLSSANQISFLYCIKTCSYLSKPKMRQDNLKNKFPNVETFKNSIWKPFHYLLIRCLLMYMLWPKPLNNS